MNIKNLFSDAMIAYLNSGKGLNGAEVKGLLDHINALPDLSGASPFLGGGSVAVNAAPVGGGDVLRQIEAMVGDIVSRGQSKPFKFNKGVTLQSWPSVGPFGRSFPGASDVLAMGKTKAREHFTNTGKLAYSVGPYKYYLDGSDGTSHYGQPIAANTWRALAQGFGQSATYIRPDEVSKALKDIKGRSAAEIEETLKAHGIGVVVNTPVAAEPVATIEAPAKPKRERKAKK